MVVVTFDTETTGLLTDPNARIIEIGAVRHDIETGQILGDFQSLCRPNPGLLQDSHFELSQRISGITKEEILNAPEYTQVVSDFVRWCGKDLVYAWNNPFDHRMLQRFWQDMIATENKNHIESAFDMMNSLKIGGCWQHLYAYAHPDRAGRWDNGNLKTISMKRTMIYEGFQGEQTHRALDDAKLAANIGHIINQLLKGEQ